MTDPTPLYYQSAPTPSSNDESNLRVLSILHYVWGGLETLIGCFFSIYIVMGFMMANGAFNPPSGPGAATPPPQVGYFLAAFGGCMVIGSCALGICTIISGRKMATRKSRIFSIVIAGINCIHFPLGTLLGVFTLSVLAKQSVKHMYGPAM